MFHVPIGWIIVGLILFAGLGFFGGEYIENATWVKAEAERQAQADAAVKASEDKAAAIQQKNDELNTQLEAKNGTVQTDIQNAYNKNEDLLNSIINTPISPISLYPNTDTNVGYQCSQGGTNCSGSRASSGTNSMPTSPSSSTKFTEPTSSLRLSKRAAQILVDDAKLANIWEAYANECYNWAQSITQPVSIK